MLIFQGLCSTSGVYHKLMEVYMKQQTPKMDPKSYRYFVQGLFLLCPGGGCAIFVVGRRQLEIACLHVLEIAG